VLSAIGLVLDLVGAVALTLGLFGHSRYTTVGLSRGPADVAHDRAFGIVGAFFLSLGFVLQGLQYVGVQVDTSHAANAVAALAALVLAALIAYVGFGLIYIIACRREEDWVADHLKEIGASRPHTATRPTKRVARGRFGWRFWHHEIIPPAHRGT
jgi:hypothetical protein